MWRKLYLLEVIAKTLKLKGCTDSIHHFNRTSKHMKCHGTLRLNLLAANESYGRLRT